MICCRARPGLTLTTNRYGRLQEREKYPQWVEVAMRYFRPGHSARGDALRAAFDRGGLPGYLAAVRSHLHAIDDE